MPGREEKTCQRDLRQFHHEGAAGTLPCEYKNICLALPLAAAPFSLSPPRSSSKLFDYPIIAVRSSQSVGLPSNGLRFRGGKDKRVEFYFPVRANRVKNRSIYSVCIYAQANRVTMMRKYVWNNFLKNVKNSSRICQRIGRRISNYFSKCGISP